MPSLKKFPLKTSPGEIILVEWDQIFYIEAERDDTLVRLKGKSIRCHTQPLEEVEPRLPSPPFFRIHRSYLVNLDRVFALRTRRDGEYELQMDPPVNKVLPVGRQRYPRLKKMLGL